jgi:hypothetical protein
VHEVLACDIRGELLDCCGKSTGVVDGVPSAEVLKQRIEVALTGAKMRRATARLQSSAVDAIGVATRYSPLTTAVVEHASVPDRNSEGPAESLNDVVRGKATLVPQEQSAAKGAVAGSSLPKDSHQSRYNVLAAGGTKTVTRSVKAISVNVITLADNGDASDNDAYRYDRLGLIIEQARKLDTLFVGVQEARQKESRMWIRQGFAALTSPRDSHAGAGCLLLVNLDLPVIPGDRSSTLKAEHLTLRIAESRLLVCSVRAPSLKLFDDDPHAWSDLTFNHLLEYKEIVDVFVKENRTKRWLIPFIDGTEAADPQAVSFKDPYLPFTCEHCGDRFACAQACGVHRRTLHGFRIDVRSKVWGTRCPCCQKQFHERPRLIQHLAYDSARCKAIFAQGEFLSLPRDLVAQLDAQDASKARARRHLGLPERFAEVPAWSEGPLL